MAEDSDWDRRIDKGAEGISPLGEVMQEASEKISRLIFGNELRDEEGKEIAVISRDQVPDVIDSVLTPLARRSDDEIHQLIREYRGE